MQEGMTGFLKQVGFFTKCIYPAVQKAWLGYFYNPIVFEVTFEQI